MWPMDLRGLDGYESALEKGRESAEALGTYIDLWVFFLPRPMVLRLRGYIPLHC
jgi:hypothetical protein